MLHLGGVTRVGFSLSASACSDRSGKPRFVTALREARWWTVARMIFCKTNQNSGQGAMVQG